MYHYSTSYDTSQKSDNIHFGIGFISLGWNLSASGRGIVRNLSYSASGLYARLSYFRAFPQRGQEGRQTLIGLNLTLKSFNSGSAVLTDNSGSVDAVRLLDPNGFNSTDLSFIIGANF